jgi:hypothetical protein
MPKKQEEYHLQKQVCQYLRLQYPEILFSSDTIASCALTMPQAVRNKAIQKEGFKMPDLCIWKPSGKFHACFIELKAKSPYSKKGELYNDKHLLGQADTLDKLFALGYDTYFAWTLDMAKDIIDNYLKSDK